ncbi:galactose-3-O-sulfotransferase 2-like, partial [Pelobates cultripes]
SFWDQVEKFGRKRMDCELGELRRKRSEMAQVCLQGEADPDRQISKTLPIRKSQDSWAQSETRIK